VSTAGLLRTDPVAFSYESRNLGKSFSASSLLTASVSRSCHKRPLNSTGSCARKFALRQHGFELPLHPFKVTTQLRGNGMMRKVRTVHVAG
jgi:hypothetical protein